MLLRAPSFVGTGLIAIVMMGGSGSVGCSSDEGEPGPTGASSGSSVVADAGGETEGGKKKAAESGCKEDSECETGICFVDNQSFCTVKCTKETATDVCVAPYTGSCNNKGFCKRN